MPSIRHPPSKRPRTGCATREMTGAQCEPVSRLLPEQDIGAAYAVQQLNVERRIARGGGSSAARSA